MTCSYSGCSAVVHCRQRCKPHYERWRNSNDFVRKPRSPAPSMMPYPQRAELFRRRLADTAPLVTADGCHEWTGRTDGRGYGGLSINNEQWKAHRLSYEAHVGPIGPGLLVCHRCDNPLCINPEHLFLGTQTDNMRDCAAKSRTRRTPTVFGETHHKVNADDAAARAAIEKYLSGGYTQREIARELGVSQTSVWNWLHGKTRALIDSRQPHAGRSVTT